jgi:hypothetical protein
VIYDWDSLSADYEAVFVGGAAASFTYTDDDPTWPGLEEVEAFLGDFVQARGTPFSPPEERATRAAAVYARAYTTRCTHAVGKDTGPQRLRELAEALL